MDVIRRSKGLCKQLRGVAKASLSPNFRCDWLIEPYVFLKSNYHFNGLSSSNWFLQKGTRATDSIDSQVMRDLCKVAESMDQCAKPETSSLFVCR